MYRIKFLPISILALATAALAFFVGPKPEKLTISATPINLGATLNPEDQVRSWESKKEIKLDNQARIIWADSSKKIQTEYSVVYIHGFSASQGEGEPVHRDFAKRYGCNLFLSRLEGHGLVSEEPFLDLKAERMIQSTKEAIAIGKRLGKRVILMSTSTGGTLSLYLAQKDPIVAALILYSPNIDLFDPRSFLLTQPWGLYISRTVLQSKYFTFPGDAAIKNYWYTKYRIEGLIELKRLIQHTMLHETFKSVYQPTFVGYYYKNEDEQDDIVSVDKILEMYEQLSTSSEQKKLVKFTNVGHHALASKFYSKNIPAVEQQTFRFAEEVLKLIPVK